MDPDVKFWEDRNALVGQETNEHGLIYYRRLFEIADLLLYKRNKKCHSFFIKEIPVFYTKVEKQEFPSIIFEYGGKKQTRAILNDAQKQGFYRNEIWKDMYGVERAFVSYV